MGSVRCDAVGEGLFSAVALEMDPATRIFTTLPVVPFADNQVPLASTPFSAANNSSSLSTQAVTGRIGGRAFLIHAV